MAAHSLSPARVAEARFGFSTRRFEAGDARVLLTGDVTPRAGDLVLARVTRIGHHTRIELPSGRRAELHLGDEIVVAYGSRYAPD
jgi:hypothetical protein